MVSIFWAVELVLIMSKTIVKISDVAKLAGVSSSTASFVLNGHGDAMHISKETQEKVWSAAKHLNYSYGSSPPRVRKVKTTGLPAITIFWTADRNFSNMTRAFISLQQSIFKKQLNAEVVLKPFVSGKLTDAIARNAVSSSSGAIIGGALEQDIQSVEEMDLQIPIVFFDRYSTKYNSVYVNREIGPLLIKRIKEKGFSNICVIAPDNISGYSTTRSESIRKECDRRHITCRAIYKDNDFSNIDFGYEITRTIMSGVDRPDLLIFLQEELTVGGIRALREMGFQGAKDVEIIAYCSNEYADYLGMPITRLMSPYTLMSDRVVDILIEQTVNPHRNPVSIAIGCNIIWRGRLA
jgi:LacI family transcriptional regulator